MLRFSAWTALALVARRRHALVSALTWRDCPTRAALGDGSAHVLPVNIGLRMTLILPAIATDAPCATWVNAYQDTRGHSWGILLTYLAGEVPCVLAGVALMVLARLVLTTGAPADGARRRSAQDRRHGRHAGFADGPNAVSVCSAVTVRALASRLFQLLGDRVKRLPGPQTA